MQTQAQEAILAPLPAAASYLFFECLGEVEQARQLLRTVKLDNDLVAIGQPLAQQLGLPMAELLNYPLFANAQRSLPQTPVDLLVWVRAGDPGEVALKVRHWRAVLAPQFRLVSSVDAFLHRQGRDLTGYEDGTENPRGDAARDAALVQQGVHAGASLLALQQWQHLMDQVDACTRTQMNHIVGRDQASNRELEDAPLGAHVKRTEQESFEPHRFVVRRSMPWAHSGNMGLMFAAFGCDAKAFEAQMWQMMGREDGIEDALFSISVPLSGAYFYCPPLVERQLFLD